MATPTSTVLKVLVPAAIAVFVVALARRQRLDPRQDLGMRWPGALPVLAWLGAYAAYMLGTDALFHWRGPFDFAPWRAIPLAVAVARVLAVGVIGPTAEELVFRGYGYARLTRTRLGVGRSIGLLAAAWSVVHIEYGWQVLLLLFGAGLLLGAARHRTGSVVTPVAMHVLWNLYAIW